MNWRTIRTYLLWGFWWALFFQWLSIMLVFYYGTLTNRPDLNILEKILGIFSGALYGLIVFTFPALVSAVVAFAFILLAGVVIAIWNRDNTRTEILVPLIVGVALGAAFAVLDWHFNIGTFAQVPYFWIMDVVTVALATLLCWRRFRKKNPPVVA